MKIFLQINVSLRLYVYYNFSWSAKHWHFYNITARYIRAKSIFNTFEHVLKMRIETNREGMKNIMNISYCVRSHVYAEWVLCFYLVDFIYELGSRFISLVFGRYILFPIINLSINVNAVIFVRSCFPINNCISGVRKNLNLNSGLGWEEISILGLIWGRGWKWKGVYGPKFNTKLH